MGLDATICWVNCSLYLNFRAYLRIGLSSDVWMTSHTSEFFARLGLGETVSFTRRIRWVRVPHLVRLRPLGGMAYAADLKSANLRIVPVRVREGLPCSDGGTADALVSKTSILYGCEGANPSLSTNGMWRNSRRPRLRIEYP